MSHDTSRCGSVLASIVLADKAKLSYIDQFLAITAMTLAKTSLVLLFRRIMSKGHVTNLYLTLTLLVLVYFIFGIFATAFQCRLPDPWTMDLARCPTHGRLLYAIIALNIVTDAVLAVWILPSVWRLNMDRNSRKVVVTLFASRVMYEHDLPLLSSANVSY